MKKKDMLLIFIFLALISFSDGLFYNFQELWLVDNNFTIKTVSTLFSLCSLLTVSVIFLCSNLIRKEHLKKFMVCSLAVKIICITALYMLHSTGLHFFIKLLIMFDFVIDIEIYTSVYPMMALICKDDRAYAKKDIIYNASYYLGVIMTSFLLGKKLGFVNINYNSYLYIALFVAILALIVLSFVRLDRYVEKTYIDKNDKLIIEKLYDDIKNDKISKLYFNAIIANQLSYYSVFGLTILLLTKGLSFSPSTASSFSMILGILAVFIGIIVLEKLTFKNDYINVSIKIGMRLVLFFLAGIFGFKAFFLIALAYAKLISVSYTHILDAPYINRINKDYQLAYCNLKGMVTYLGKSAALYLCGFLMNINIRLNFLSAGIFCLLELLFRFKALKLKHLEESSSSK